MGIFWWTNAALAVVSVAMFFDADAYRRADVPHHPALIGDAASW